MTHTISKGCPCARCQEEFIIPPFPGKEINDVKHAAYVESRRQHGIMLGRPPGRRPIRGAHDTDPIYDISEKPDGQADPSQTT